MMEKCVFGVIDTPRGREIENEMTEWLSKFYDVRKVYHDGKLFEYPAILEAKNLSIREHCSVLYLHTKGAVNFSFTNMNVRKMWKTEFSDVNKYFKPLETDIPTVIAPFVGVGKVVQTWYNGFVANYAAWNLLNIRQTTDRYFYEAVFQETPGIKYIGAVMDGVVAGCGRYSPEQAKMVSIVNSYALK